MTELGDRLLGLIDAVDDAGIVALLAPLDEAARAAVAPLVGQRARELKREYDSDRGYPPSPVAEHARIRLHPAHLAWLGTGDLDTLPPAVHNDSANMRWYLHRACASAAGHQVLVDRRPPWLAELVAQHLDYGHWMWDPVWRLVLAGLIERPTTTQYLRGVALHAGKSGDEPLAEMVRRDPLLIGHDLPALLALPDGLANLVQGDRRNRAIVGRDEFRAWSPLLAALPTGHPLRDGLLTDLLTALGGDIGREASTFHTFLVELHPDPDELAVRRHALFRLAGHRVPAVVSVAIPALSKVDKRQPLDPTDVVAHLGPATGAPSAATARGAVRLIVAALARQPELASKAATSLAPALTHRRSEVQLAAVQALLPHAADAAVATALAAARPDLTPTAAAAIGFRLPPSPPLPLTISPHSWPGPRLWYRQRMTPISKRR